MEYVDKRNGIVWTEEMFSECERLWDYFEMHKSLEDKDNIKKILWDSKTTKLKFSPLGWLVYNGYTVETFTEEYAGIPTEQVLLVLLP